MKNGVEQSMVCAASRKHFVLSIAVGLCLFALSHGAFAAGDELGDGVCGLVNLLTGKWLFGFTILAIIAGGAGLLMGGEISDGVKKIATIITVVGLILGASSILALAFKSFGSSAC